MRSSKEQKLQCDVLAELDSDPQVDVDRMFVDVDGNVVMLTGTVANLHQKSAAQDAARRVRGVAAVIEQINVEVPLRDRRNDADVARTIANQLRGDVAIPATVQATVDAGNVVLTGTVGSQFEREAVASIARRVVGVRSVANAIAVHEIA